MTGKPGRDGAGARLAGTLAAFRHRGRRKPRSILRGLRARCAAGARNRLRQAVVQLARWPLQQPQNNYLGIEVHRPGVPAESLLRRLHAERLANVRVLCADAKEGCWRATSPMHRLAAVYVPVSPTRGRSSANTSAGWCSPTSSNSCGAKLKPAGAAPGDRLAGLRRTHGGARRGIRFRARARGACGRTPNTTPAGGASRHAVRDLVYVRVA